MLLLSLSLWVLQKTRDGLVLCLNLRGSLLGVSRPIAEGRLEAVAIYMFQYYKLLLFPEILKLIKVINGVFEHILSHCFQHPSSYHISRSCKCIEGRDGFRISPVLMCCILDTD